MWKILVYLIMVFILFSCKKKEIIPYYKVSINHQEIDFINGEFFHPLIDRIKLTTDRYLMKFDDSLITLYFEKDYDTNQIRNVILKENRLEFWHTFSNIDIGNSIYEDVNKILSDSLYSGYLKKNEDLETKDSLFYKNLNQKEQQEIFNKTSPLSAKLYPYANQQNQWIQGSVLGYAKINDTNKINIFFSKNNVKNILPNRLKLMWEENSYGKTEDGIPLFNLYLLKQSKDKLPLLSNIDIKNVRQEFDPITKKPMISLIFKKESAKIWGDMTEYSSKNQTCIAITVNDKVFSSPIASERIDGGRTQITGGSFNELNGEKAAKELTRTLNLGALPKLIKLKKITILQ